MVPEPPTEGKEPSVAEVLRELREMKTDLSSLKADVSELKADVSTLKADVSTLKANSTATWDELENIRAQMRRAALQPREASGSYRYETPYLPNEDLHRYLWGLIHNPDQSVPPLPMDGVGIYGWAGRMY